jgi:hypothetical protein
MTVKDQVRGEYRLNRIQFDIKTSIELTAKHFGLSVEKTKELLELD